MRLVPLGVAAALDPIVVRAGAVAAVAGLGSALGALIPRLLALVAVAREAGLLLAAARAEEAVQHRRTALLARTRPGVCHFTCLAFLVELTRDKSGTLHQSNSVTS